MATTTDKKSISAGQEEEINSLRDYFKDNIRILSSIGQFSYILKIRADQYDVSLTLQLDSKFSNRTIRVTHSFSIEESYPTKAPEIMITAPRLTPDQILLVQQLLQTYSETLVNTPMILSIYTRLLKWFDENKIQTLTVNTNNSNTNINNASISPSPRSPTNSKSISSFLPLNNHTRPAQTDEHDAEHAKKSSAKTIDDVLSHLESDTRLDKRFVRIGYLDQHQNLQEKSLDSFDSKTDLPTFTDRQTNSKSRIQYLKYANELIWDKDSRVDLIFGSTSNQQTISDVIKRHENLSETK